MFAIGAHNLFVGKLCSMTALDTEICFGVLLTADNLACEDDAVAAPAVYGASLGTKQCTYRSYPTLILRIRALSIVIPGVVARHCSHGIAWATPYLSKWSYFDAATSPMRSRYRCAAMYLSHEFLFSGNNLSSVFIISYHNCLESNILFPFPIYPCAQL